MKYLFLVFILSLICSTGFSQTREEDLTYIIQYFINQEIDPKYKTRIIDQNQVPKSNEIKATIQYVLFTTVSDNKDRGTGVVYREKRGENELVKTVAFCIPENNSETNIKVKCMNTIKELDDTFILKLILMGVIKIGLKK